MPLTHLFVAAAQLQAFEPPAAAANPARLLRSWQQTSSLLLQHESLCLPQEIAYAKALGLPSDEGLIPWAAYETKHLNQPCAWLHWCHLDVGMTDMVMQNSHQLQLSAAESRELFALIAPYFEQDGIELEAHGAERWLAKGQQFAQLPCASLARVQGHSINQWLPDAGKFPQQTKLARLQAEVQMLLYSHPLNDARAARGLPTVNSFWLDGAGELNAMPTPSGTVTLDTRLQDALHSPEHYASAWQNLLAEIDQQAQQALALRQDYQLTLCGQQAAISWQARPAGLKSYFLGLLAPKSSSNMRSML